MRISLKDAEDIRRAFFGEYPRLERYFAACQARVESHGWLANCFGRYRRFPRDFVNQVPNEWKRQAMNFPIQSGVADYVSRALDLFYTYPGRYDAHGRPRYRLVLQIHDAVLVEVRITDLEWWLEEVVPACMTRIPIYRCDLNGERLSEQRYFMGCGREIMRSWGVPMGREEGLALGVPEKYLPLE